MSKPRSLGCLLADGRLGRLFNRAEALSELDRLLRNHLPPSIAAHCKVANVRDGILILHADAPVWAARLRYQLPQLQQSIHTLAAFANISRIDVRVVPAARKLTPTHPARAMSLETAQVLRSVAETNPGTPLAAAFERLSRRYTKSNKS